MFTMNKSGKYLIISVFLSFFLIAGIIGKVSLFSIAMIILLNLSLFVLGNEIKSYLKITKREDVVFHIFETYGIGVVFSLLLYLCLLLVNRQTYVVIIYWAIILFILIKNLLKPRREDSQKNNWKLIWGALLFVAVAVGYRLITFQLFNIKPAHNGYTNYYCDLLFWMEGCVSATKGFPLPLLHFSGAEFHYHYFSCVFTAFVKMVTRTDMYDVCFAFSYIWESFILVGAVYMLFRLIVKNPFLTFLAEFILLFTTGYETRVGITYNHHINIAPFGFSLALAFGMMSVMYFYEAYIGEKKSMYAISCICFFASMGCKSSVGVILLACFGMCCIFMLTEKKIKQGLILGIVYLLVFVLTYYVFLKSETVAAFGVGKGIIGEISGVLTREYYASLYSHLIERLGIVLSSIITVVKYLFDAQPIIFALFISSLSLLIYKKQKINKLMISLLIAIGIGASITIFMPLNGSSHMYFLMSAFPFTLFFSFFVFEKVSTTIRSNNKQYMFVLMGLVLGIGVMYFSKFSYNAYGYEQDRLLVSGIRLWSNRGSENVIFALENNSYFYRMSSNEWEAIQWIKNNTDEEDILIANNITDFRGGEMILPAVEAFSERESYYSAPAINSFSNITDEELQEDRRNLVVQYFSEKHKARRKQSYEKLKSEGVDYIITYKMYPHNDDKTDNIVYENEEICIRKL